jgi:hypothetical protein
MNSTKNPYKINQKLFLYGMKLFGRAQLLKYLFFFYGTLFTVQKCLGMLSLIKKNENLKVPSIHICKCVCCFFLRQK